eukprot:5451177-Alexandrium_andersonii.AAC.1
MVRVRAPRRTASQCLRKLWPQCARTPGWCLPAEPTVPAFVPGRRAITAARAPEPPGAWPPVSLGTWPTVCLIARPALFICP